MVRGIKNIFVIGIIALTVGVCSAQEFNIADGVEAYKNGNYDACITVMKNVVKNDPADVVAYYYLGLAYTKTGKEILAVQNYNKVININSDSSLSALAKTGKDKLGKKKVTSIETQIEDIEEEYNPILNDGVVEERSVVKDAESKTEPKTTKVIKASDYAEAGVSGVNGNNHQQNQNAYNPNREPTNDDIVNAIRTLQKAGLLQNGAMGLTGNMNNNNLPLDSRTQQMNSMLMMMNNGNNNNNMMQMLPYMNNGGKVDPQMMQMMLMQQMMPNFGGNNNNNNGY